MDEIDIELGRAEQELLQEEAGLATELARLQSAAVDIGQRVDILKRVVSDAETLGAGDAELSARARAFAVPKIAGDNVVGQVRVARQQAIAARKGATQTLRQSILAWKGQMQKLGQGLTADERTAERLLGQAKAKHRDQTPVPSAALSDTLIRPAKAAPLPPPPPAVPPGLHATPRVLPQAVMPGLPSRRPGDATPPPTRNEAVKRLSPRVRMQAAVDLTSENNFFAGFSANISDGGLFVATMKLLPLGTDVDLQFTLPSGDKVDAKGVVRWVREPNELQPDAFPGIGVQFSGLEGPALAAIQRFVQSREPMFYSE